MDFIGERNEGCICFLVCFTPGCPPCMRRCNGHGDGALHRGRSCLRHQSLLLRLHPERNQVHLPQEVCSCSPWPNVTSQGFCFLKCCFWPCFLVSTPASIGAPLLLHSLSTFFESGFFFFFPFLFWGSRSCTHCHLLSRIRTHNLYLLSMFFSFFFVHCRSLIITADSMRQQCHITFTTGSAPPLFSLSPVLSATGSRVLYVNALLDIKESQENPVGGNVAVVRIIICSVTEK